MSLGFAFSLERLGQSSEEGSCVLSGELDIPVEQWSSKLVEILASLHGAGETLRFQLSEDHVEYLCRKGPRR